MKFNYKNRFLRSLEKCVTRLKSRAKKIFPTNKLGANQERLLLKMRKENELASFPFRADPIWHKLAIRFEALLKAEGIMNVEEQRFNNFFSSPKPQDPKLLRYACWLYYNTLKQKDFLDILSKVPATVQQSSGLSFSFDQNLISWDLLVSIDNLYAIAEANPSILNEPVVVVDLGAGWGRLGYLIKSVNKKACYVICDLPEALLISSEYLPRLLPNEQVTSFMESRSVQNFTKEWFLNQAGLVFLGSQDLSRFEENSIDFFINIASFQEMSVNQVHAYLKIINAKTKGVFFTQQLYNSKSHNYSMGEIDNYLDYKFPKNWQQIYFRNSSFSDLYFECAYTVE